ncbi:PH domain-containing protein [Brachybacterium fresconis]|uniref:Low molecular weight protein antigen 6 PH domain-containing protein n=1 Tax=Brachybacterium fresconis TaxID=173363 RepID=A0ABS4YPI7_9MICO|nr:PH domain-containing protein [Brachybacterium fresconis]MBP2410505.1 hypothetical protein [Brachybacterium fresconis]
MTIPRQLGPRTGPRTALPDYSRSAATVERMVSNLDHAPRRRSGARPGAVRTLLPRAATRDTVLRAVVAVLWLGTALLIAVGLVVLWASVEDGHAPGIALLLVMLMLGASLVLVGVLGVRFALVALGTARSCVEISEEGLHVVGAFRSRTVPWPRIRAVESRVVHPVHWLTAALRLDDGSRVLMPAFDRHIWTYSEPAGQDIRALRVELHRQQKASARFF